MYYGKTAVCAIRLYKNAKVSMSVCLHGLNVCRHDNGYYRYSIYTNRHVWRQVTGKATYNAHITHSYITTCTDYKHKEVMSLLQSRIRLTCLLCMSTPLPVVLKAYTWQSMWLLRHMRVHGTDQTTGLSQLQILILDSLYQLHKSMQYLQPTAWVRIALQYGHWSRSNDDSQNQDNRRGL